MRCTLTWLKSYFIGFAVNRHSTFTFSAFQSFRMYFWPQIFWPAWFYVHLNTCNWIVRNHGLHVCFTLIRWNSWNNFRAQIKRTKKRIFQCGGSHETTEPWQLRCIQLHWEHSLECFHVISNILLLACSQRYWQTGVQQVKLFWRSHFELVQLESGQFDLVQKINTIQLPWITCLRWLNYATTNA